MLGAGLLGGGLGTRQGKGEGAILTVLAVHRNGFAVSLNDGLGDKHTQTHTGLIQTAALVTLIKALED